MIVRLKELTKCREQRSPLSIQLARLEERVEELERLVDPASQENWGAYLAKLGVTVGEGPQNAQDVSDRKTMP